ncbi:HAMP domain-containing sensor histidine kinase [Nonomuraea sp. NEAU-A123]|uniref:sensor histidine kinase n=1 Tax=Nonomuraea sp. NEAU-A123 TaxID=2839649 RepID=UPI001BE3CF2A|nr:HAMP domain-containing sensor histidine kinase [Nonomuraea sp. NEAU-A123]MBT2229761.1 HAMP domain-containing histidine kinase [Nonomuraea sp. NEAU-A123]
MRGRAAADPERRLLIGARRRITVQVAGAISLVLALFGAVVYGVTVSDQHDSARRDLAAATRHGSVTHPPPCVWLFELRDGTLQSSPGAPEALPLDTALYLAAGSAPQVDQVELAGQTYLVRTERHGDVATQAVMDLRYQAAERHRLLRTLAAAELAGLLAALLIGQVLARRAIAPLGEALARQRRFAADVSHELRTPLTRLHTRAQLVARQLRRGTDRILVIDEVDQLVTGTRQLGEVVEDLLVSAQLKQLRRPFVPVDLAALAEELAVAEAARAAALGVTIEVRRQGLEDHIVRGAQSALRRVIAALLDNALGHTSMGGHIWVTVFGDSEVVELKVRDDGVGLDPEDSERLFTRFVGRGFGLGLALVREVVDGHGGTITADGRPGAGAVFTVRLPADPAIPHRPAPRSEPADHPGHPGHADRSDRSDREPERRF